MIPVLASIDEVVQLFGALVALLVCILALRMQRFTRDNNFYLLASSFGFLVAGFLVRISVATIAYFHYKNNLLALVTSFPRMISYGLFAYAVLIIFAYMLLALWALKPDKYITGLLVLLTGLLALLSTFVPMVFYYTALIFLAVVTLKSWRTSRPRWVAFSFGLLAIANVCWMFRGVIPSLFLIGNIVELSGFVVLLAALMRVVRN